MHLSSTCIYAQFENYWFGPYYVPSKRKCAEQILLHILELVKWFSFLFSSCATSLRTQLVLVKQERVWNVSEKMANKDNNSDTDFVNVIQQHKNNSSSLSFLHQQNMDSSPTQTGKNETFFSFSIYLFIFSKHRRVCSGFKAKRQSWFLQNSLSRYLRQIVRFSFSLEHIINPLYI